MGCMADTAIEPGAGCGATTSARRLLRRQSSRGPRLAGLPRSTCFRSSAGRRCCCAAFLCSHPLEWLVRGFSFGSSTSSRTDFYVHAIVDALYSPEDQAPGMPWVRSRRSGLTISVPRALCNRSIGATSCGHNRGCSAPSSRQRRVAVRDSGACAGSRRGRSRPASWR
jgi:hypothetical protein